MILLNLQKVETVDQKHKNRAYLSIPAKILSISPKQMLLIIY